MNKIYFAILLLSYIYLSSGCNVSQEVNIDGNTTIKYLLSHQKENGAFGPSGMSYTDLAWTYPAVHALILLDSKIPRADSAYENGHKPWIEKADWKNGPWYWSLHQKSSLYKLLGKNGKLETGMTPGMEVELKFISRTDYTEYRDYLDGKFYDISSLWNVVEAISVIGGSITNIGFVEKYILSRQASQGGFEDMLGNRKTPRDEKAHIIVTHDAVMTLQALEIPVPNKEKVISWVQSLQSSDGGFRWNPESDSPSNESDVWYTWAAVKTLDVLGAGPKNVSDCLRWLNSLQNTDGGFGDRPGWQSRLYSTYYAVHAIDILSGNARLGIKPKSGAVNKNGIIPEGEYSIFQAHHKSPRGGEGMVDTVAGMGLNIIGVKTTERELYYKESNGMSDVVRDARDYAKKQGYELEIVDAPENYSHKLKWFSGMSGNHVSNYMIPPDISKDKWEVIKSSYEAGKESMAWQEYKRYVIGPIINMGNLFYPELDYTMLNAYIVYDEGLNSKNGYNAVPAAHFGNYDWVRHFPYKERWLGKLPMIADGDAHGNIQEWKSNLESFRNVFIAKDYTYDNYIDASKNNRSVCVIKMPSGEIRYYGSNAAIEYIKKHKEEWKWWD